MGRLGSLIVTLSLCVIAHYSSAEASFNGEKALQHIASQIAYGPRSPNNPQGKQQTLNYIKKTLEPLTDSLVEQPFYYQKLQGINLWATVQGTGDQAASERIMLGAHWDTRPLQGKNVNKVNLGANDGASGVAVLLELARIPLFHPGGKCRFVFFDLEDMGNINRLPFAIGSRQFVKTNATYQPSAGIIVDMVCDKSLSILRERHSKSRQTFKQ